MKQNAVLKAICYTLLPLLLLVIVLFFSYGMGYGNDYASFTEEYEGIDTWINRLMYGVGTFSGFIYIALPVSIIMLILVLIYLIESMGYSKGKDGININSFDKMPFELLIIAGMLGTISLWTWIIFFLSSFQDYKTFLSLMLTGGVITYIAFMLIFNTFVKRIKAKIMFKTTLIGKTLLTIKDKLDNIELSFREYKEEKDRKLEEKRKVEESTFQITVKLILYIFAYFLAVFVVTSFIYSVSSDLLISAFIIDIAITVYVFIKIIDNIKSFNVIEMQLEKIYNGDIKSKLDIESIMPRFKNTAKYINDISNGFENAIEEGIKSERLKTELITNVSHDIKTPLTSIINYVDLLKKEDIKGEKAKEYISILDNKSQRLKRLTEDLLEASKASSGNVKLNLENINMVELLNQAIGEFGDKFKQRKLEVITNFPEESVMINADSRYMYRVIENIFSNAAKYATKGSRVYIDVVLNENKVYTTIKNMSAQRLNISTDELMQRFVRGDKSRTTEGSGLRSFYIKEFNRVTKGQVLYYY